MTVKNRLSRRDFLRLASVGVAGATLAACAVPAPPSAPAAVQESAAPPAKAPVVLSYWHIWGGARVEQLQTVFDAFTEEHPDITVEPLLLPNPGYADKIITGLAGDPPDLTMIYTDEFAPSAKRSALMAIDDFMADAGLTSDLWYPGIWNMTQWDGKTYGIPFVGNFLAMTYWNTDDYTNAGLDPEKGATTWAEQIEVASELTTFDADGNVEHLGYVPAGVGEWMHGTYRNGGNWYGDGTPDNVTIDQPDSVAALQYAADLYESMGGWDAVGSATDVWGNQQLGNPMIAGVASSILSGVFTVNVINQSKPDLNYKIGKVPHGPNGDHLDLIQACWNNCIPAQAKQPEAAWELAKYLSAGDGHLKFMVEIQGRPAMVKSYNEAPYDAAAREQNPYWNEVLEILSGTQASFPVSDKLGAAQRTTGEAFESVLLGQRTVEEGAAWAQAEVVAIFAEE